MANEFVARKGIVSLGNIQVSGSISATGAITITGSIASASFAATASSADNFVVRQNLTGSNVLATGTITAQTLVVQTVTSSIVYSSGSNIFGNLPSNVQQFTGSLRVTGSGNHWVIGGNVGLGTSSPSYNLHIQGASPRIWMVDTTTNGSCFEVAADTTSVGIFNRSNLPLVLGTNNTTRLTIAATGIASFTCQVCVTGNADTSAGLVVNNSSGASGTCQHYINFTAGATNIARMFRGNGASGVVANGLNIDSFDGFQVRLNQLGGSGGSFNILGGNVGIGTSSPSGKLDVSGSLGNFYVGTSGAELFFTRNENNDFLANAGSSAGIRLGAQSYLRFDTGTTLTERLRITSTGIACFACQICTTTLRATSVDISAGSSAAFSFGVDQQSTFAFGSLNGKRVAIIRDSTCADNGLQFGYDVVDKTGVIAGSATAAGVGIDFYTYNGSVWGNRMRLTKDGQLGIGTTSLSTEANLFLGNQGSGAANEGGQLVLQKAFSCSCATHLDNYQNTFRILSGTDTTSTAVNMVVDHRTRNACFFGDLIAPQIYSSTSLISIPNSATTIFTSTGFGGVWLVTYSVSGNPTQVGYAIVGNAFGTTLTVLASAAGSQTALSVSGLNLQLSQSAGGSINTTINVIKLATTFG